MNCFNRLISFFYLVRIVVPSYLVYQYHNNKLQISCDHEPMARLYLGLSALSFMALYSRTAILAYQAELLAVIVYTYFVAGCDNDSAWKYLKVDGVVTFVLVVGIGLNMLCHRKGKLVSSRSSHDGTRVDGYGNVYLVEEA